MTKIYVLIYGTCSEMGFFTPKILGCFFDKKEAEKEQKKFREILNTNYGVMISEGLIQLPNNEVKIPVSVLEGLDVA